MECAGLPETLKETSLFQAIIGEDPGAKYEQGSGGEALKVPAT